MPIISHYQYKLYVHIFVLYTRYDYSWFLWGICFLTLSARGGIFAREYFNTVSKTLLIKISVTFMYSPNYESRLVLKILNCSRIKCLLPENPAWFMPGPKYSHARKNSQKDLCMKCGTCFYHNFSQAMQKLYQNPTLILLKVHGEHCQGHLHALDKWELEYMIFGVYPNFSQGMRKLFRKLPPILLRVHVLCYFSLNKSLFYCTARVWTFRCPPGAFRRTKRAVYVYLRRGQIGPPTICGSTKKTSTN